MPFIRRAQSTAQIVSRPNKKSKSLVLLAVPAGVPSNSIGVTVTTGLRHPVACRRPSQAQAQAFRWQRTSLVSHQASGRYDPGIDHSDIETTT
jgi:hypothetical protein